MKSHACACRCAQRGRRMAAQPEHRWGRGGKGDQREEGLRTECSSAGDRRGQCYRSCRRCVASQSQWSKRRQWGVGSPWRHSLKICHLGPDHHSSSSGNNNNSRSSSDSSSRIVAISAVRKGIAEAKFAQAEKRPGREKARAQTSASLERQRVVVIGKHGNWSLCCARVLATFLRLER